MDGTHGIHNVANHLFAAYLVQDLGELGIHPHPLARRKDNRRPLVHLATEITNTYLILP